MEQFLDFGSLSYTTKNKILIHFFKICFKSFVENGRCGCNFIDGYGNSTGAQCDHESEAFCCSEFGWCGNTAEHCSSNSSIDYRKGNHSAQN